ncbi:MAG: hypothetical protein KTR31_22665 [Myxococcales bacterium]|nr:hypothetical protein [Myxococcales bacterium]
MIATMLSTMALAGSPQGTTNTDATLIVGFRPGFAAQVDHGVWKGFWVGGRWSSQQEAYLAAGNLGQFDVTGTWHHGLYVGGGLRGVLGRSERWDVEISVFLGTELSFVREEVTYVNSGQQPPYSVRDQRFYQSWQAGLNLIPFPTLRYRFAKNHGIVIQPWFPLSRPLAIERNYVSVGWTARWGGSRIGSGGASAP